MTSVAYSSTMRKSQENTRKSKYVSIITLGKPGCAPLRFFVNFGMLWYMYIHFLFHNSSRMIQIQMQMAERALELLSLPEDQPSYILDVG